MREVKKTILVVDDDKLILNLLFNLLIADYRVLLADRAQIAQGILGAEANIDLVMVDYHMPEMNGLQFLTYVRRAYPHIKRVLISGRIGLETIASTVNHEISHRIVTKPWDDRELLEILHEVLSRDTEPVTTLQEHQKVLLSGKLRGMAIADVLCLLSANKKSGFLQLRSERLGEARIFLKEGRVVYYSPNTSHAQMKLDEVIETREGSYCFVEDQGFNIADTLHATETVMII